MPPGMNVSYVPQTNNIHPFNSNIIKADLCPTVKPIEPFDITDYPDYPRTKKTGHPDSPDFPGFPGGLATVIFS